MCLQLAEEVNRMRTSYELHTARDLENIYNAVAYEKERHRHSMPGGYSSFDNTTDSERTSNSGSDTPIGESIPFQALSMSPDERTWQMMRSAESSTGYNFELKLSSDEDMDHLSGDDLKESTNEDMENSLGKDVDAVQSKLCPRGHWRPGEDDKLRELVSQYGPQNWNLIAEKLQGRSGNGLPL